MKQKLFSSCWKGEKMPERLYIKPPQGELFEAAVRVVQEICRAGFKAYWVGGAVRDMVLHRLPDDVDMVTTARPEQLLAVFQDAEMVGACFGVVLVKYSGFVFEVATCREERSYQDGRHPEDIRFTDDVELDLKRRDFTVNSMLYDPSESVVIDYNGGLQDIKARLLRVVGVPQERFGEDYLRMFRAVRFAAKLEFDIEETAWQAIREMAALTGKLAAERVRDEIEMMLCSLHPRRALELLKESGLLKVWLPEADVLAGVEQHPKYHPEGDVWEHTLLMFDKLKAVPEPLLAWSMLLHDIGKKPTFARGEDGIPHFYGHEAVGADMIPPIAERMRFSRGMAEGIEHAVRYHMRFASVMEMRPAKLKRLMAEKNFETELELHRVDCLASNGLVQGYEFLSRKLNSDKPRILPEPLINGLDLIRMGYQPGAQFKVILEKVMDCQLEEQFCNKAEAEMWIRSQFPLM